MRVGGGNYHKRLLRGRFAGSGSGFQAAAERPVGIRSGGHGNVVQVQWGAVLALHAQWRAVLAGFAFDEANRLLAFARPVNPA